MKKIYNSPKIQVVQLQVFSLICTSPLPVSVSDAEMDDLDEFE